MLLCCLQKARRHRNFLSNKHLNIPLGCFSAPLTAIQKKSNNKEVGKNKKRRGITASYEKNWFSLLVKMEDYNFPKWCFWLR
jgi:hypothetical protein